MTDLAIVWSTPFPSAEDAVLSAPDESAAIAEALARIKLYRQMLRHTLAQLHEANKTIAALRADRRAA